MHHRRGGRCLGAVQHGRTAGCRCVGDDEAAEPPVLLERSVQEHGTLRGRRPVDGVVGRHHRPRTGVRDQRPERRKIPLLERATAHIYRVRVPPPLADVRHEVLGRRDDPLPFECPHELPSHDAREVDVLAVGLLDASPAHIGREVHHRREDLPNAPTARFARRRLVHTSHEERVPGRREGDRLRKDGRSRAHQSVQGLVEHDDRHTRAGDEPPLDRVDARGMCPRGIA